MKILFLLCLSAFSMKTAHLGLFLEKPESGLDTPDYIETNEILVNHALQTRQAELKARGFQIGIKRYYTHGNSKKTYEVARQAAQETLAGVGFPSSDEAVLAADAFEGSSYVAISPLASSDQLIGRSHLLTLAPFNSYQARVMEELLRKKYLGKKVAVVVALDSPFSLNYWNAFSEPFKRQASLIQIEEKLYNEAEALKKILQAKPDVLVSVTFPVLTGSIIQSVVKAGHLCVFLGPDSWGEGPDSRLAALLKGISFEGLTLRPFTTLRLSPAQKKVSVAVSKDLKQKTIPSQAYLLYDAVNLIVDSILTVGIEPSKIKNHLLKIKIFSALSGRACLSQKECPEKEFFLVRVGKTVAPEILRATSSGKVGP